MKFSKESLVNVSRDLIVEERLRDSRGYRWVDVVGIPQRPDNLKDVLFLATHSDGKGGWDNGFDRRPYAREVAEKKGWSLAIDSEAELGSNDYVRVRSLDVLTERLYETARTEVSPYVIGVTGSVGKTTVTAFLEHLLSEAETGVVRFYSKRLTPLSVACHYINRVDRDTNVVVMEYSAYLREHVATLSRILPPNLAFMLNIYDTHINPGMFEDKSDIYASKLRIKPESSAGYINRRILEEIGAENPEGWESFSVEVPDSLTNFMLPPTLRTAELYTVGKLTAKNMGIPDQILRRAYETFTPVEKRMIVCNFQGRNIFFQGETSGGSRLWSWFETTDGSVPWFLVEEVNFADEDPLGFKDLLERVFGSERTYVLDTPANRERLPVKTNFVDFDRFREILTDVSRGYTVFHKALATRGKDFNPTAHLNEVYG
ncbi:hypothetical protein A2368_02030 [Candidatus Collierbacteria bacterium RIFOXYB1_FULL_49_13]|uniref:Mur ligase central domain-containing protein n=1 Tax=Candidatus Collierbacteria bacterium RIFOXYB1_FULL_49_13 TaxID=1817728 RepID=A0A1F5FG89_9BACT|nr:MAG: hypothetical protein A2368_02030 [Candidatus Collierbacteria bacterium RIFOXYB1_FULL_49_13]